MWENGKQHGEGTIILPNFTFKKGIWNEGKRKNSIMISEEESEKIRKELMEMKEQEIVKSEEER